MTRVLFPEGAEPRVVAAAAELGRGGAIVPVLLGQAAEIEGVLRALGAAPGSVAIAEPDPARHANALRALRDHPPGVAERLLRRPAYLGAMMLRQGEADALVLGARHTTAEALIAFEMILGDGSAPSSFFVLDAPHARAGVARRLVLADCAVQPNPSAEELASIAMRAAAAAARVLDDAPRVALLSFSTHCSAPHPDSEKVAAAAALVKGRAPSLFVDGDIQADAALDPEIAGFKSSAGEVAGRANVLVFPDLDAANIGYKLLTVLGGANAYGVFLQGLAKPVAKVSRGATAAEIVETTRILARLSGGSDAG